MCLEKESQVFLGGRAGRKETLRRDRKELPRRSSGLATARALPGDGFEPWWVTEISYAV